MATSAIDFSKYEAQAPAAASGAAPQIDFSKYTAPAPDKTADDTGVLASLKRAGGGLIHLPGAIYDAVTKPPQNPDEEKTHTLGGPGALALQRLITDPMVAEHAKAQQARAAYDAMTSDQQNADRQNQTGNYHMANMHNIASAVPLIGPMSADITQRYLSGDKSGAVTDLATAIAGPKLTEGAVNGMVRGVAKVAPEVAERMYTSALKPSTTIPAAQRANIVKTGLDAGIPVSPAGAEKLSGLIQDLNSKISDQIKAGAQAGQTVDPVSVASRADQARARFTNQVNPAADLKAIDSAKQEFLDSQHVPPSGTAGPVPGIPVDQAQALKSGTYQQLKSRAYGELGSATIEAQKALARGLKEELQTQFPEIKNLNAQEGQFLNLDGVLEKSLNRISNHQLMGIGTPIVAGAVGGTAGGGAGIAAGVLKAVLDDPIAKSRLAIAISKAGGITPSAAMLKISQYSNALAHSQPQQDK